MDTIKDRNGMDLREAEDIKKRWQEYTELHKKDLNDPDNHDGVITHLEPDILECEVKCALGSITMNKASGDDGIPAELFQILKDDAVKVLHSICQHIWKTQQWPQDWKSSGFIPIPNKGNAKNVLATTQLHSSHTLPKWKWKWKWLSYVWLFVTPVHGILQARILEWVAFPFSSGSSQPRSRTLQAHSLQAEPQRKARNTGMGSLSLLQQIFLTQELNWGLLHCRQFLYQLSCQGSAMLAK